jgi:hypothetical protein
MSAMVRVTSSCRFAPFFALLLVASILGLSGCAGLVSPSSGNPNNEGQLILSNVAASGATSTGFQVAWTTNLAATSQVNYGKTASYGNTTGKNSSMVTSHAVSLSSLSPGTTYHFQIQSTDAAGATVTSGDMTLATLVGNVQPTVSIVSPAPGATLSGTNVVIDATASDSLGITSVQFKVDGANVGSPVTVSPYTYSLNTTLFSNGAHTLTATATDQGGNSATSAAVSVTVNNAGSSSPTVSITAPTNGATVSSTVTVSASASDSVGIASVQFEIDSANVGTAVTTAPYTFSWDTTKSTNGAHALTAIATDKAGHSAVSSTISVTVNNASKTTPTVSITAPTNGATLSSTVTVSASASASVGIASVQFLLDGGNLGTNVTSSPYSVQWNTAQTSNGSHTLAAKATDTAGNMATSSAITVTVSQSQTPPPPVGDQVTITDASGLGQTNRPVSIARPFAQGEIANFAQASIGGSALLTQCDVKNRWPDGSLKFAVISFVIPSISANGSVVVSFANQSTGNNTGFLAQSDMLNSAYNFDGQIRLSGTASHNISARGVLSAAGSCSDPGSDPDGGQFECTYWLKGPIVTAVILEDRLHRSFDVNVDGGTGNPLHPIFEAWFYPQGSAVQLGYTLENIWASTTPSNSARDQVYSVSLTGGNANPSTLFTNGSFTHNTRARWHKTFCINGPSAGSPFDCAGASLHFDHNWPYLASTHFFPNWDPTLTLAPSVMSGYYSNMFGTASRTTFQGCSNCYDGGGAGIGLYDAGFDSGGVDPVHGPLTTWDIIYLMSQCDAGNATSAACDSGGAGDMHAVMLTNSDLAGMLPYWYREADSGAGHGGFFDAPTNSVPTQGRIVSINARTQVNLLDATAQGSCNNNYPTDWINFGGSTGQDVGVWSGAIDTSHWPNTSYAAYVSTGQYAYYEEQLMQSAYAVGLAGESFGSSRACVGSSGALRQGSAGYWENDQERGNDWQGRENMLGAFIAVDGSPESTYLLDKLRVNLAAWEGAHNISCDIPGTGPNIPYCAGGNSAWTFGNTVRIHYPNSAGTSLGAWAEGVYTAQAPLNTSGTLVPSVANSHFQTAYSTTVIGWLNDLGYCPGSCAMLDYIANYYLNEALNPAANIYDLGDYVFPTLDQNGNQFTSWSQEQTYYVSHPTSWDGCNQDTDESYHLESMAAMSFMFNRTSSQGGYSGAQAWNAIRNTAGCLSGPGNTFQSDSPKWDIVPRQ